MSYLYISLSLVGFEVGEGIDHWSQNRSYQCLPWKETAKTFQLWSSRDIELLGFHFGLWIGISILLLWIM